MFLVCAPYLATDPAKPDSFIVNGLGPAPVPPATSIPPVTTPATVNSDGTVELHYDLTSTPDGTYTVTVEASLAGTVSKGSASFTFTLPVPPPLVPNVPQGIALSAV
jgi:hypothetical protein